MMCCELILYHIFVHAYVPNGKVHKLSASVNNFMSEVKVM